jgi:hypothetical protein
MVHWVQDAIVILRNSVRREFRKLGHMYGFILGCLEDNKRLYANWCARGSFMHHWVINGVTQYFFSVFPTLIPPRQDGLSFPFSNRAILAMLRSIFYKSPNSIARRMYNLLAHFPVLLEMAPGLSWTLAIPINAWILCSLSVSDTSQCYVLYIDLSVGT